MKISRSVTDADSVNSSGCLRVVLPRLFLGDRQLRADFLALDLLDQHLALQLLPQVVHRHAFLRQRLPGTSRRPRASVPCGCWRRPLELIVAELEPELACRAAAAAARRSAFTRICGVISASAFFSVSSFFSDSGSTCWPCMRWRSAGDLPLLELGLRDDVAVHLHEDLLDDVARASAPRRTPQRAIAAAKSCFFIIFNILAYLNAFAQVAEEARNPAEDAPFGPGIFLGRAAESRPG